MDDPYVGASPRSVHLDLWSRVAAETCGVVIVAVSLRKIVILATGVGRVIAYLERRVREDLRVVDDAGLPDGELPISAWVADAFRAAGIRSGQTPATARLLREYERMLRRPVRKDFRDVGSPSLSALGRVLRELEATDRPLSSLQDRLGRREETASAWIKRFENALYRRLDE